MAFSCLAVGEAVAHVFGLFLVLSAVALVAAFVRSLWKRAWSRAAAQCGMFVLGQVAFFGAAMGALVASEAVADWRGSGPWQESREKNGVVPFEVEYRIARFPPMFSGSYLTLDRRVAFVSGKRVEFGGGTGVEFRSLCAGRRCVRGGPLFVNSSLFSVNCLTLARNCSFFSGLSTVSVR